MIENEHDIWKVITSVLEGTASAEEHVYFNNWLNESDGNRRFFEAIKKWMRPVKIVSAEVRERIYSKLQSEVLPTKSPRLVNFWMYGAVATISIIVAFTFFTIYFKPFASEKITFIEATIPNGVKSKITLPDGTLVYLNSGSYFRYPARFTGKSREVFIKGEAYFEVKHDPGHQFVVATEFLDIKVYGTHFNVKSFAGENLVETTLMEGSVGIFDKSDKNADEIIRLKPNQKATFEIQTGRINLKDVDGELTASWKEGKYYFSGETLFSIAKKLERNFNVPIRINSGELNDEIFSGLFDKNKTVFQILDIMRHHKNLNYKLKNDTIFIYK